MFNKKNVDNFGFQEVELKAQTQLYVPLTDDGTFWVREHGTLHRDGPTKLEPGDKVKIFVNNNQPVLAERVIWQANGEGKPKDFARVEHGFFVLASNLDIEGTTNRYSPKSDQELQFQPGDEKIVYLPRKKWNVSDVLQKLSNVGQRLIGSGK